LSRFVTLVLKTGGVGKTALLNARQRDALRVALALGAGIAREPARSLTGKDGPFHVPSP